MTRAPDAVDRALGAAIRAHRRAAGLSQAELGRATGISFQQIQKYETGDNRVSVSRLFHLSRQLGVEPQALIAEAQAMTAADRPPAPDPRRAFLSTEAGRRAIDALLALEDPALLAALTELAESAAGARAPEAAR